ncbi:penicillin-binding transpeptidase domain-containing protein [Bovifimicola ammoniilytica]|uniref:penicillin-binding transpeptidase domain-containing protein n=1 Tax=Bovifimicola ammoniilytica TaxID=2981720 RepID=UPI000823542D|nr:penicillin-binding transpeptidase domain-containing protein [Bovifimicola ammoniilytica]MCU6753387.1 penicillin-binding transpeptidase domain-containing protein [Bovifimicola ammoniilytica]SCJ61213.1 Penicillin-binding protein 2B [uncultured Eubacterium sp.]
MVKEFFEYILSILKSRLFVLGIIVVLLFSVLMIRIFNVQIVNGEYYLENYIQMAEREVLTSGTRGIIYDRNGEVLAYNKLAYAIEIEDDISDSTENKDKKLNEIISETINIITSNGDTLINDFPIILNTNNEFEFSVSSDNERLRFLRDIYGKKSISELDTKKETLSTSTADDVMKYLCGEKMFDISDEYDKAEQIKIAMVRYNLSLNRFQKYISTKIASNVSEETVAAIYEAQAELKGVTVSEETVRVYNDSVYFAHILGYTGTISEDQLAELNSDGGSYISSDVVGKSGIEKEMESYLQGTKGKSTIFVDNTGRILENVSKTDAKAGNDVYLTLDAKLQKAGYTILEQKLAGILYSKIVNYDVTPSEDMKTIPIPVKDVYYQIINNNVVDLNKFGLESASDNEKNIYAKFAAKQSGVINWVYSELTTDTPEALSALPEENNTYLSYIYTKLADTEGIINKKAIDSEDETYQKWTNETISLREFLLYAISKNWINTSKIFDSSEVKYSDTDEIYNKLVEHIYNSLPTDTGFSKKIYYYLIYSGSISGNQVCMLLYDQNVLEYDEAAYTALRSGSSAFEFIREQIKQIKITPAQLALDPCSGSLVVTDTNSGDVLALVTYPSYDNNKLSGSVDAVYWKQLNSDLSLPLYNRATQTRTAPGSTFKMLSAITGLEEGYLTPGRTITDLGEFKKITPSPKCWRYPGNHGSINVSQALEHSCNYFFYEVGYELSIDEHGGFSSDLGLSKLKKYGVQLGLTTKSGVEIEENEPLFSTDNSVRSAIGQGSNSFANIQLARYVNTVANSGHNYQLTLLNKVIDTDGNLIKQYEPTLTNTTNFSQSTWDAVHYGMRLVITGGTAKGTFNGFQINVAGKSGTAQENKLRSNHSVFVAYAPYENPEIALSVLIPNGESSGYTAEVVRDTIKYYYGLTTDEELYGGIASIPTSGVTND